MTVTSVPGSDISDLLAPQQGRRQELPGFDAEFVDIVDYIVRITHRIWEGKNLSLIHDYYTDDCIVHTLAGETHGAEGVIASTLATLQTFPDRVLFADQVVWSEDRERGFYTSHRITSHNTHMGESEWGQPTGCRATVRAIADCAIRQNKIYEEWLVRDSWSLAVQIGADPASLALKLASFDSKRPELLEYWALERARTLVCSNRSRACRPSQAGNPEALAHAIFGGSWNARNLGLFHEIYSPTVEWNGPSGRRLFGVGPVIGFAASVLAAFPDSVICVEHVASVPILDWGTEIAVRWSLTGMHTGPGFHGAPTGLPIYLMAISHWQVTNGQITEEWTIFDELALLRQLRRETVQR